MTLVATNNTFHNVRSGYYCTKTFSQTLEFNQKGSNITYLGATNSNYEVKKNLKIIISKKITIL
jgi:hypothetical protein